MAGLKPDDLDLLVATGPGVPGFELLGWFLAPWSSSIHPACRVCRSIGGFARSIAQCSALMFIRVYVGLMLVPHFCSHILGGPFQFKIYTLYFASLGLHMPAIQVALAGSVELITAIGLVLGLFTRPVHCSDQCICCLSMLWGGHFHIGYVWALPEGGYEFGVFGP